MGAPVMTPSFGRRNHHMPKYPGRMRFANAGMMNCSGPGCVSFGNHMKKYKPEFGAVRFSGQRKFGSDYEFGKRRRSSKKRPASRKKAMTAFRKFYKRYCKSGPVRRSRFGFGEGGNPPLWQTMGYEFCPDGQGGVLQTTGLFASPCTSAPSPVAPAVKPVAPAPAPAPAPAVKPVAPATTTPPALPTLPTLPALGGKFGGRRKSRRRRY
jgi:hypothetical protein